jgi:hypothetical protein
LIPCTGDRMRSVILLALASFVLSESAVAQRVPAPTPEMLALEAKLLTRVGPETRAWIKKEAARQNASRVDYETGTTHAVRLNPNLRKLPDGNIEAITFLVLMEAANSAQDDVKGIMARVKAINVEKTSLRDSITKKNLADSRARAKRRLDSMSEMGEMESLRLQMAMDRLSKLMSTLSNLLKKASETATGITQNIK